MFKQKLKQILTAPAVAKSSHLLFSLLGQKNLSNWIMYNANTPPEIITLDLPSTFENRSINLESALGKDQVVRQIAKHGWKSFETPLPEILARSIKSNTTVLDIGANTGYYAVLAAAKNNSIKVHAFEPFPGAADILERNLAANSFTKGNVILSKIAISSSSGHQELYLPIDDHGLVETSASLNKEFRKEHSEIIEVTTSTLDNYIKENAITDVDLIKIDVEGLEHEVLMGAQETLKTHRPKIFLEILDDANIPLLEEAISGLDYTIVQLDIKSIRIVDQIEFNSNNPNQSLWPSERLQDLKKIAHSLGYVISE